ncbi:MAG: SAM-dependent methyltransferase [Paracoccaceae bacterium]
MTLLNTLLDRIEQHGPMTVADYMNECLLHPHLGYYATRDPLGEAGDFITAPEISQMFGELVGLALARAWMDQGKPAQFTLAEVGPGRGTLMADILRATRSVPGFTKSARIVLIEASPVLREIQRETLSDHVPDWIANMDRLPEAPLFIVANEFFDALPIRQFIRDGQFWRERCIGAADGALQFGLGAPLPRADLDYRLDDTRNGDLVEICPAASTIMTEIGQRIEVHGGAGLLIDYGDWRSQGDTFQSVRNHTFADPLKNPGQADLTAHVDFEALCLSAPCAHTRLTPQGVFLERLGIAQRTEALSKSGDETLSKELRIAHHRLTHASEMGNLFKTLGLYQTNGAPPPGLDP